MKVWDLATRVYHWLQAVLFVALFATGKIGIGPHIPLGLMLLTLLVWRLGWGFFGSETARFTSFRYSPFATWRYLQGIKKANAGHNPVGAWMVFTLITLLLLQCISGLALAGFLETLPFAQVWLTDSVADFFTAMHLVLATGLPWVVGIHIGAIILYQFRGQPLIQTMITGRQKMQRDQPEPTFVSSLRALFVLLGAVFVTMTMVVLSME
ncbi:cytochrome b/b6 domain-containing protein [Photobacterium galatheae]|uniref:cytochrome b/b6 domain-containing protein n=1 Tax=Photobacterium galatheae TaxID=1654360 RepID=UPI00202D09D4|nr:cytochrome b/b6 domain-containing protein [Photobacterium galatheae]